MGGKGLQINLISCPNCAAAFQRACLKDKAREGRLHVEGLVECTELPKGWPGVWMVETGELAGLHQDRKRKQAHLPPFKES